MVVVILGGMEDSGFMRMVVILVIIPRSLF